MKKIRFVQTAIAALIVILFVSCSTIIVRLTGMFIGEGMETAIILTGNI
jgi:hypothetical protein